MSKFRLSNHKLPIEKLRYDNVKREDRLCEICNLNTVGSENHYMLCCQNNKIRTIRENFIIEIIKIVPEFIKLGDKNIIKYCLKMTDPNLQLITAMYIKNILKTYNLVNELKVNDKYIEIFM